MIVCATRNIDGCKSGVDSRSNEKSNLGCKLKKKKKKKKKTPQRCFMGIMTVNKSDCNVKKLHCR